MNKDRVLSSTIMIAISYFAILNIWVFNIFFLLLITGGLYEFFHLMNKKELPVYSYTGIGIGLMIPVALIFQPKLPVNFELFFIVLVLVLVFSLQLIQNDNKNAIVGISTTLMGVLYVSWFFSYLIKLKHLLPGAEGVYLVGFLLLITKCGDMGALIIGSKYGKRPLLKRVSPNKTIEGSIGSFCFSVIAAIAAQGLLPAQIHFSLIHLILMGLFFGGLGQLGDLCESLIKRDCGVKDSGKMLPGLGGALDAIDSILFSAPAFYFYISSLLEVI